MANPIASTPEKPEDKLPSERDRATTTDHTLAREVDQARTGARPLQARDVTSDDNKSVATRQRAPVDVAEHSIQARLNPDEHPQIISSRVADSTFERRFTGNSNFEARQYLVQANRADGRPSVETVRLSAGGQDYQGFRTLNPDSGKEYFFTNDGKRFEMVKGQNGYESLKPLGQEHVQDKPLTITTQPKISAPYRSEGDLGGPRPADSNAQMRPQRLDVPQGQREPNSVDSKGIQPPRPESGQPQERQHNPQPQERTQIPPQPEQPVNINPKVVAQIKEQLQANPQLLTELQKQSSQDWRAAAILKELGYTKTSGDATTSSAIVRAAEKEATPGKVDLPAKGELPIKSPEPGRPAPAHLDASGGDRSLTARLDDPASRQAVLNALSIIEKGRLPTTGDPARDMRMQDVLRNVGPENLVRLQLLLTDQRGQSQLNLENRFDPASQARLREFFDLTMGVTRQDAGLKLPADFATMLRQNELLTGQNRVLDASTTGRTMLELTNMLRQFNNQESQSQSQPLTMRDLLARNLDDQRQATPLKEFTARAQDALTAREMIDLLSGRRAMSEISNLRPEAKFDIKTDAVRSDIVDRTNSITQASDIAAAMSAEYRPLTPGELDIDKQLRLDADKDSKQKQDDARRQQDDEALRAGKALEDARNARDNQSESAALLAAMRGEKGKQDIKEEEAAAEKIKKDQEKRIKYVVKTGDTLESIATKMLRDKQLSGLIYDINKEVIATRIERGKTVADLKAGLVIWLPTSQDIKDYRIRLLSGAARTGGSASSSAPNAGISLSTAATPQDGFASAEDELAARFGTNWSGATEATPSAQVQPATPDTLKSDLDASARQAFASRRSNIENMLGPLTKHADTEPPRYVARLGDTLKSIAVKHPALNDVRLWRLLAQINGLSIEADDKGNPLVRLKRGQVLALPMQDQVDAFLKEIGVAAAVKTQPAEIAKARNPRRTGQNLKPVSQIGQSVEVEQGFRLVKESGGNSRLLQKGDAHNISAGFCLRLEFKQEKSWLPVVMYEIFNDVSLRHEYKLTGDRKTIRIDLPPQAAVELAQNDITSNWSNYCLKFNKPK